MSFYIQSFSQLSIHHNNRVNEECISLSISYDVKFCNGKSLLLIKSFIFSPREDKGTFHFFHVQFSSEKVLEEIALIQLDRVNDSAIIYHTFMITDITKDSSAFLKIRQPVY